MAWIKRGKLVENDELWADLSAYIEKNYRPGDIVLERGIFAEAYEEDEDINALSCADISMPQRQERQRPMASSPMPKMSMESAPMPKMSMEPSPMLLSPKRSLEEVVANLDKSFMEMVFTIADAKGMTDLEVRKKAELDKRTFSKLKCGTTKTPSKSTALALAIALELNLDETKDLLGRAGLALSPCYKSDLIVQYFIEQEAYDIGIINDALYKHGEALLGSWE